MKALGVAVLGNSAFRTDEEITRVYNKFVDTVYRVCFMMLKNSAETEDAVQNVFIKYINHDKEFESDENIKAWLIVVAKNECKNILKHWFRSKRTDLDSVGEPSYEDSHNDGEVMEKLMSLEKKYRLPLYLYYYEGYSTPEIAQMMDTNHSTLRTNLAKARKKLKIMLEEDEYETKRV